MNKFKHIIVIFLLISTTIFAQYYINPVSTAMAGAYGTKARGAYINGWNPANLGLAGNPRFSMNFGILPLVCLLYTSPSPRDLSTSRMPSSA